MEPPYRVHTRVLDSKKRGEEIRHYLGIQLPDKADDINYNQDTQVKLEIEEKDDTQYLEVTETEDLKDPLAYKIRVDENLYPAGVIPLPMRWVEYKEESPFYGIEGGEELYLSVLPEEGVLRIYHPDNYPY